MKKLAILEGAVKIVAASIGGIALTFLTLDVPMGYSDAEVATVGRIYYYGFPFPRGTAPGYEIMYSFGQMVERLPFNIAFWTALLLFLFCIQSRRRYWKLLVVTVISHGVFWAALYVLQSIL